MLISSAAPAYNKFDRQGSDPPADLDLCDDGFPGSAPG